jgi:membrane peptidoglycan carboxypeptidase
LDSRFPRARIERGGLTIISTLDYDLQSQSSCVTAFYAARLRAADPVIDCEPLRFLAPLPPETKIEDSSASAVITDPRTGQILALVVGAPGAGNALKRHMSQDPRWMR